MNTVKDILTELHTFPGRESDLRAITRFSNLKVMLYRTNLWIHSQRVAWLTSEILPFAEQTFGKELDPDKALALALVHDDAEILTGDIQAGNKAKMSKEELAKIDEQEAQAIAPLVERFPKTVGGYEYRQLLFEALHKDTLEAQIVMIADKMDAFGESLHEVYAGNHYWITNVVNEYGHIPLPTDYYIEYLNGVTNRYPKLKPLFAHDFWMFTPAPITDFTEICTQASLHTATSLQKDTGYLHYDKWKQLVISHEGTDLLLNPVESL